jgi:hypothetical protein
LPPDLDPVRSVTRNESEQSERSALGTHDLLKASQGEKGDWAWVESWDLLVQAHGAKTKGSYGVGPMPPDLKRQDRKALGECLDGASTEVAAKLRARGMERELGQVRRELAERVIALYFRNDTPHLRKTKHALRDLPREFHARITDAMQAILRESHDKQPSRRVLEEQVVRVARELSSSTAGENAQKPAEIAKAAPMPLHEITAMVQKTREILEVSPTKQPRPKPAAEPMTPPSMPARSKSALPDWFVEELNREQASKQAQKAPETPQDLPSASQTIERPLGRPGAPRWGSLGPRPAKVSSVRHVPENPGEGGEPPPTE